MSITFRNLRSYFTRRKVRIKRVRSKGSEITVPLILREIGFAENEALNNIFDTLPNFTDITRVFMKIIRKVVCLATFTKAYNKISMTFKNIDKNF